MDVGFLAGLALLTKCNKVGLELHLDLSWDSFLLLLQTKHLVLEVFSLCKPNIKECVCLPTQCACTCVCVFASDSNH